MAPASMSTWATVAPGPMSAPCRSVHMFSEQPQPTTRSAPWISSAASGEAKPPLTSRSHWLPRNSPLAAAEVASSAPQASASRSQLGRPRAAGPRAAAGDEHRPLGPLQQAGQRLGLAVRAAAAAAPPRGMRWAGLTSGQVHSPACTSSGRARITQRRSPAAVR